MKAGSNHAIVPDELRAQQTLRVLLIEDSEDDAILARHDLARVKRCKFEVDWVRTLADGIERLKRGDIDVVLLDLSLPDSRGFETFDRLSSAFRQVPILVLTGYDDEEAAIQTVRRGAQDYLVKVQMNSDTLGRAIFYAIERKHAARQMATLAEELALRNGLLLDELELAHEIQRALLPISQFPEPGQANPDSHPWFLTHRYLPTESLAGDFFKVYPLSEGRVGVLICDVMGHGVRSALVAALLCGLIEEFEFERESPGWMLTRLNAALHRVLGQCRRADMFATACYLVADPLHGKVTISNAGHPMPYLLRHSGAKVEPVDHSRGPALGLFDDSAYPETTIRIDQDDTIVLYTDGISEVEASGGGFFEERLPDALRQRIAYDGESLLDGLLEEARGFSGTGGFHDDVCLIALKIGRTAIGVTAAAGIGTEVGG